MSTAQEASPEYLVAPPGFGAEQRAHFEREGFLHLDGVLPQHEIDSYLGAIERVLAANPKWPHGNFLAPENVVERDPAFVPLIDHPRHVGFVYDYFGELLQLHLSQFMVRPPGSWHNQWHPDGPRAVPYGVHVPERPPVIKVMIWLTDLPEPRMGNMVLMPGSHHSQYFEHYDTDARVEGERVVCCPRGSMTLVDARLWHRVEPNESDVVRQNVSLSYSPSWLVPQDRYRSDAGFLEGLTREQRIIMRDYDYPYKHAKPPARDFPLYLDRETGADRDPGVYGDHVVLERRKRLTPDERGR